MPNDEFEKRADTWFAANHEKNIALRQSNVSSRNVSEVSQPDNILEDSLIKDGVIFLLLIVAIMLSYRVLTLEQNTAITMGILIPLLMMKFFGVSLKSKAVLNLMGLLIVHGAVLCVVGSSSANPGLKELVARQGPKELAGV